MKRLMILAILCGMAHAQLATLPVDSLAWMNTSTPGTPLTASILNAGTLGSDSCAVTWSAVQGSGIFAVGANQGTNTNLSPVSVNGSSTVYPSNTLNYNSVAMADSGTIVNVVGNFGCTTITNLSAAYDVTFSYLTNASGSDWDRMVIVGNDGPAYTVSQFNGRACNNSSPGIRIEGVSSGGSIVWSDCIPLPSITTPTTYHVSLNDDMADGTAQLYIYTPYGTALPCTADSGPGGTASYTTCNSDGSVSLTGLISSGHYISNIWFGNNENGNHSGTTTYFQNFMLDWTHHASPLTWTPQTWQPFLYYSTAPGTPCNPIDETAPGECAYDWTTAGIPGGIPSGSYTQSGTTLSPSGGSDSSAINAALSSCGGTSSAGKYVLLGAGTFSITSSLSVPSYCVLRGAGAGSTILNATLTSGNVINLGGGSPSTSNRVSITAGGNAGSTTVTVSSASGFAVGDLVSISQLQDGVIVNNVGTEGTCTWCDGFENDDGLRAHGQTGLVTAVNGTNITLDTPLMVNYTNTPEITPYSPGAIKAGVENLQIYANGTRSNGTTNGNFYINSCLYCWVSGIEDNYADGDHGFVDYSYHGEIINSYFSGDYYHDAGQNDDSVTLRLKTTGFLVQNNIFERLMSAVEAEWGASGNVIAYNYSFSGFLTGSPNFVNQDLNTHGAHEQFNLYEGNVSNTCGQDSIWGSDANNTTFRSWCKGTSKICGTTSDVQEGRFTVPSCSTYYYQPQAARAIDPQALNTNFNMIANVEGSADQSSLGTVTPLAIAVCGTGVPSGVGCGSASRDYQASYNETFGYGTSSDTGSQSIDSEIPWLTAFVHGEYANAGCPSASRTGSTCTSGLTTITGVSTTYPASFYLSTEPSWWPSSVPWPAIGPDVTGGSGPGGHVYSTTAGNAAQYCYTAIMGGSDGGPGSPLPFNANTCYPSGSALAPPTGLTAVVN